MFKNHPKGLLPAALTNLGERFGFYTMMAILVLFLQAKYGLSEEEAGSYYSWFYFSIYALALVGGMIADSTKKYKAVIFAGQVVMFAGYVLIAMPGVSLYGSLASLFIIALGNGLFKGNLQAVVGQMYDDPKYAKLRDNAFMIFYMGINVGAFFAPFAAMGIRNWWLSTHGFLHDGSLPALCHQMINGTLADTATFQELANNAVKSGQPVADLTSFAHEYLNVFSTGYNWAFGVAACAMIVSLIVYIVFNKTLPTVQKPAKDVSGTKSSGIFAGHAGTVALAIGLVGVVAVLCHFLGQYFGIEQINYKLGLAVGLFVGFISMMFGLSTKEEKPRIIALCMVFVVAVFFWMSFHQNGLTLTFFARDYTAKEVGSFTNLFFNLYPLLCVIATIVGVVLAFRKGEISKRILGGALTLAGGIACYLFTSSFGTSNAISPEVFQSFNPLFIVALTPVVMGYFSYLAGKGREPSTPRKIGIGMVIAAIGFCLILVASLDLVSPRLLGGSPVPEASRVSPYWLMSTYLVLTIAELFLSPMGLSFVSKVAPVRFQGLMQSGWLLATATGNKFLFIGSLLWNRIDLYLLWGIFVICCLVSALFIFSIMKRLEKATN